MSMSGHQSARMKSDTWLTPPEILRALGAFDLDPCCPPAMPWKTAAQMIAPPRDGLSEPWMGRVWLNPPFGNRAAAWLAKLAEHGNGIALIPARTETGMFYTSVWGRLTPCFSCKEGHIFTTRTEHGQRSIPAHRLRWWHTARGTHAPSKRVGLGYACIGRTPSIMLGLKGRSMNALVRCWVVLRNYDYEGQEIQAVFDNEAAAKEFCEAQEKTVICHSSVEEWPVRHTSNAQGHRYRGPICSAIPLRCHAANSALAWTTPRWAKPIEPRLHSQRNGSCS